MGYVRSALLLIVAAGLAMSCSSTTSHVEANTQGSAGSEKSSAAASTGGAAATQAGGAGHDHEHALHNLHKVTEGVYSGGVPEGDPAFDELKAMGVRTVISVDGAIPDIERAKARGMRYVHVPTTYAEVTEEQKLEIARAIRDLPGPVYLHCHHGKHRGPASVAAASVALGKLTPEEAVSFMKTAGTAPHYQGLYACVAAATAVPGSTLDTVSAEFAEVRRPRGMVAAMVEVDYAYEHLGYIRDAGWKVPTDHPDLVPGAEAGRLTDNLRLSGEDSKAAALGADYAMKLAEAVKAATELEEGIIRNAAHGELEKSWKLVVASCKDCHTVYRDKK